MVILPIKAFSIEFLRHLQYQRGHKQPLLRIPGSEATMGLQFITMYINIFTGKEEDSMIEDFSPRRPHLSQTSAEISLLLVLKLSDQRR